MAISLESVAPPGLDQEAVEEEEQNVEPAETAEVAAEVAAEGEEEDPEPTEEIATEEPPVEVPVPKARATKKTDSTPKAAPKVAPKAAAPKPKAKTRAKAAAKKPAPIYESSSESDTPINQDDMDTMLLQFLLQRKHAQQDSRRAMWKQMAGLS